jgi:hypothetical protein
MRPWNRAMADWPAVLAAVVVGCATVCAQGAAPATAAGSIESLAWMTGAWTGTMGKAGIEEHWIAPRAKTMLGVSRTTAGERTVAFEFLRIEQRADGLYYVAQPGGRAPVDFKLTALGERTATFENPKHDHPKIIRYRREGDTLVAEIEGDEKGQHVKQSFTFSLAR